MKVSEVQEKLKSALDAAGKLEAARTCRYTLGSGWSEPCHCRRGKESGVCADVG